LVDEAHELIGGRARAYGHVVVDEAQDLSPMQVRMLARRCPAGSLTLLGDLAQGIGVWAADRWEDLVALLPSPDGVRFEELRLGYRSPGQVLDYAARLLPAAAPDIRPTEAVRQGRTPPRVLAVSGDDLVEAAAAEGAALAATWPSVAMIVPARLLAAADKALAGAGVDYGEAARDGLGRPVTLLAAAATKGLEFDAVVVVEPAAIVDDAPRGLRLLYVAMTRPTQHLSVVHSAGLPAVLATA
jgi:DNA helicase IV